MHGELHAEIHPDLPRIPNVGFLVDGQVFHPGDALTVPDEPVATLLLPVHAPWSKVAEVIDYVRAVDADQAYAVHDGLLSDTGLGVVGATAGRARPGDAHALQPAGPGGLGRALRPDRPPGNRSADGAARPAGEALGDADQQHGRDHGDDEADDVQLEDVGRSSLKRPPIRPPMMAPTMPQQQRHERCSAAACRA